MVRLRKSHTKLKIALCSVCGFFVAIGGVLGIWVLSSTLQGEKEVVRPEDTVSVRKELPSGGTYSELKSDGLDTLGYLAYVLDRQEYYHSESSTSSVAMIATQTTQSFKDYKDGIMLSSDFTYGFVSAGTQSCFVPDGNENGKGAGVYMRTSNGSVNSSSTGTNTNWNDDVRYYPEEEYLYTYGQYSTEMTVYILNDETVTSWDEVRDNGDGTYSQKFYLDAEKAAYYYQYAMKTRGGLDTLPIFKSVTLDITFDDSYHVLEIDAVEDTNITYIFSMDSTSTTTTTYSYDEVSFDQPHRDLYDAYYKDYVGKLQSGDNEEEQIDVISLLAGAFANVLNGQGQQFDATLTLGNTPYYGRVYLNVDMGGISSGDILGAIEARIQLSADQSFDSQDLYIELSDGKVSGYYSTGFALTADINSFGDIIDKFETWISTLDFGSSSDGGTDGEGEGEDQPDEGEGDSSSSLNDILEQLLGGLVLEESEGGVSVSLDISDLLGIGLSAKLDFTASEGADGTTEYSFVSADIGGITYGGENLALSLGLAPSAAENISHDESETPFNVNEAADSLYQLLSSQTLKLRLSLEGAELADFASAIGIADPGDSLNNLKLEVEGGVALDGLTVNAAVRLIDTSAEKTLLDADVYYIYNGSSGAYGTAYLAITNLLGVECDAKVYCDIADLADTITKLVASFSGEGDEGSEEGGAAVLAEDGSDLVSVINGVLSLDFGSVIKELTANNTVIGATVNADEILALLGIDVTLGDITLEYSLGDFDAEDYNTEGGWLHGSVPSLGAEVYVYGSTLAIDEINFEEYLDLDVLLGSVIGVLSSETVTVDLTVTGGAVADILAGAGLADLGASLDGLTLNVSGGVSISSLPSALAAQAKVNLTNGDLPYVVAEVFYAYEEGGMGTAYITITNLLGADLSANPVKVKCDISDAVTAIEQLIGAVEEVLPVAENGQSDGEGNDIASIISGVLAIDFGSIIKELTINADVLSTTIDADNLIAMFSDVSLGLGEITLEYNTEGALTGSALNGEVVLEVSGSDSTLTAPDDSEFLDINEVLNTVTDILTNKLVALSLDLDETGLANLLKGVGAEDYVSLAKGLGLTVDGTLDIEQLAALVNITLTRGEETLLAGQIYYDYNNEGYGTAQLYITNILGADCDIKVKCDIAELAESIQQIIAMFTQSPSMQNDAPEADNSVVAIVSQILELDFPAIIEKLTANASGFETEIDVDSLLGELEVTGITLGTVTLKYDTATEKLTGSALGGLTLEAYKGAQEVKPIDGEFLDLNDVLNTVTDILTNKLVALSLNLNEAGLETLLKGVGAEDYVSLAKGLGLTVDGTLDIEQLAALVSITLTRGEETLLAGQIYYDYDEAPDGETSYGTAQLYITNVFGAACDIKVKCDIAELAESIQQIIAMFSQSPSMQNDAPEADNTVVGIISEILELDFPAIIEKLTANASGFETEIDVDALLGELEVTGISLGKVTLKYDTATEKLTGSALGGLTLEAYKGTTTVEPIKGEFFDINEVLNTVTDILTNKLVALSLNLDETGLANLLKGVGAEDYVSLADGLGLTVDGTLDIEQLAALVNITLTRGEETLLAGQIYYEYMEAETDGETSYGTAQLYITNVLGAECDIKVKCDIAELAESIQQIIAMFTQSPSMQNDAPEADNSVVAIVSQILELDFPAIIEKLTANASGFETEINIDALLGELEVTGISLGKVTLKYDTETEKLTGSALGGLTLEAYKCTQEVKPIDGNFLDLNDVLNAVTDILTGKLVALSLNLDETGLETLLKGVGAEDYVSLAKGLNLTVDGTLDIEQLAAIVNITLTRGEETLLAGQIYYEYTEAETDGETSYGTAQLYITNILGATCDIKVKCDIAELAESIQQIIAMFTQSPSMQNDAPEADNTVVGIISEILELDFPAIIEKLTANASGFETEIDIDALLGELEVTGISLGKVTLKYDTATEKLTGSALGGLTLEAYKGAQEIKPIDGEFLDLNDVLNAVKDILENKLVALSLTLDETGLETLLKGVGAEDYVSLAKGLGLTVDGTLDIEQLAAIVNITLTRGDSSILAGQIYYDYDEAPDSETSYGTAQLYITNVLGADCDIKVKCDIAELAESIQQIIAMFTQSPSMQNDAPEADNTVVGIISQILELDFPAIIEKLTANASGFETEIDIDALLGELEVTGITLGKVTLKYDTETDKLTGSALGGLTLEAYKGTQEVKPIDGEFLDINEVLNTVKDILENKLVALSLNLDETGLETLLKGVGAEDYVSLAKGLGLTVDGTLDIEQLAALVNITLTRNEDTLLAGQIHYDYDEAAEGETSYGTAQLYITNVFGADCDIKVKCDIAELAESIQQIIAMFTQSPSMQNDAPEADNTVVGIISEILELDFPAIIEKLTANASGFETEIDVDALLGELEVTGISLGKVTLKYDKATEKLTGSALGGLTLEVYKGTQEVKPIDGNFLDINEVIDIALAVSEQVQAIINEEQIHFDIDAGAIIDGVAVGIDGSAAVDWVGGTLNKLAVTATLSLQNSGEANRSATAFTFLYNNKAADSDPYIRIGIGEEVLNITKGDIATVSAQIGDLKVQIEKLIDAINGGSAQSDGEAEQIVAEIARLSGISAITVDGGDGSIKEPDAVIIINALLDALLGANENGENVLADIFGAIMSGTSVSADDLSLAVKMLFENIGASLSIGLDNGGRLSLGGTVTSGGAEVADLHISAKSGLGGVFEKIDGSLDELNQNSSSEEVAFVKIVYDYLFKAIGNVNIGDYLGSDAYKVSFRLGGDGSKIPELAGVQVTADLYFAGNYQGGNLIRADISNLTVDGFNLSADVVYLNNTLYIDLENIDGTALSGLKVQVQADDIYKAVENIIALIKNDKVINFFGSVAGSFRTSEGEGQEAAGAAVTLSEEQEKTFTDILVALLSLDYSEVVKISSADGATTITADIDAVLEAVGVDVSVGSAQIVAEKDRLTVGLSHENSNYNWIQLVAERSESLNFDTSSLTGYIDIGFVADIVDDAGKFITSNAPADGEISTLFTLNGGTISADVDISDIDFSSALGDEWWSGIVGAVLKGLDIDPITISNIDLVIGLDSAGELYFSLEGDLSAVSVTALGFIPIEFVAANSIGITYSDGLITLKKDSGGSPIYWVMTPEYFIDNLFAEQSDENGTDSPIRWLLGTGSSIWNLIASNLGGLIDIDSGITSPDEITLYPVSNGGRDGESEEATALSQFLAGYAIDLGEENAYTYGGYSAALERLGLKDSNNYYAFALNASGLTGGMLDALDVALLRDETYGFGGLKAYASVMSGAVVVNFNIGYSGYKAPTDSSVPANYYENAVGSLSDAARQEFDNALTLNNDVTANINGIDTVYAYDVFGGVKIEGGVLDTVNTQREYVDELLTVTVYESVEDMEAGVNAATYKVRYGSVINLHDDWNIMSDDDGNVYVYVAAGDTSGTYPETYTVENDTVFYKTTVSGEEWTTAKVTINGQTFVVKHGTSLNDIVANKFGGYGVVGGWKQVISDTETVDFTATTVTEDVELEVQFARLSVTAENGVVYTLSGGTQGEGVNTVYDHYEVTGYTQAISAYYEENTTLVLENEVDGVPVTAIAANAFANSSNTEATSLKNVVVPESITVVGSRAFLDNKGIRSIIFLAQNVTFNTSDGDRKYYPFYGCSTDNNDNGSLLNIYYNGDYESDNVDTFCIKDNGWGNWYRIGDSGWGQMHDGGTWAYLDISLDADIESYASDDLRDDIVAYLADNGYSYNEAIYAGTDCMLVNLSGVSADGFKAEAESAAKLLIDTYTASVSGAVNMYSVTVEVSAMSGSLDSGFSGGIYVNIDVTDSGEAWYKTSCSYTLDGETSVVNPMNVEYEEGCSVEFNGVLYVKAGSAITLSSTNSSAYGLVSVDVNGVSNSDTADGVCEIVMPESVANIVANYQTVGTPISIYSEVSFKYDGVTYENSSDGWYSVVLGEDVAELTYGVTAELPGYYFIGWAVMNGEALEFTSDLTVSENAHFYAIWAQNNSQNLTVSFEKPEANTSSLSDIAVTSEQGSFSAWYADEDFSKEAISELGANTVVYARLSFSLGFTISGEKTKYNVTMSYPNSSSETYWEEDATGLSTNDTNKIDWLADGIADSQGTAIVVLEGAYVEVSRGDSANVILINIYNVKDADVPLYSISVQGIKMSWRGIGSWGSWREDGDRAFFDGNSHFNSNECSADGFTMPNGYNIDGNNKVWLTSESVSQNLEFILTI